MNRERIVRAISDALPAVPIPTGSSPQHALAGLLQLAVTEPARSDSRLVQLVAVLRAEPGYEAFDGYMQYFGYSGVSVDLGALAGWMLLRAQAVGAEQAVADVDRYLSAAEIPAKYTSALAGLKLDARCSLTPDLELVPWRALPESFRKKYIFEQFVLGHGSHWPTATIQRNVSVPKIHIKENERPPYQFTLPHREVEDALLCVGLVGPTAPYVLASWLEPAQWAPVIAGSGYSMPHLEGLAIRGKWPETGCSDARLVWEAFGGVDESRKSQLRLAMQRLGSAIRRPSPVDAAIDLGIVLEALFLHDAPDDRGELSYRLRVRAARYLGQDPDSRRQIFTLVGDLYSTRSIAAHTGQVPEKTRGSPTSVLLDQGFSLAASAIRRFLLDGDPDWNRVTFA